MSSESPVRIPQIDFGRLDTANPQGQEWETVTAQVMSALESFGCFEVVSDYVLPEDREAIFGVAAKELFGLPVETKMKNTSDKPRHGYIANGCVSESLLIDQANTFEGVDRFAELMWPQGNPSFCKIVETFARNLSELEQMVARMVLEKMGIEKYLASYMESSSYILRFWKYGVPSDENARIALGNHTDAGLLTIICQHRVEGLEVQQRNGNWIPIVPSSNSFTVMVGECLTALTNGRLEAPLHRVKMDSNNTRYSVIVASLPKDGCMVETPKELVDEEHPLLFTPFGYGDYMRFRLSVPGKLLSLKDYCGVRGDQGEV